jgi:LmbE family N-acetylglucosaminyl deacetylase
MLSEEHFIPYHSSNLTGKRVLVLAPHPDDETIGCGGNLALHADAGDPIKVVFLTNGAKGDMSGRYDRNSYIRLRQQEARSACACLGVTDVMFWPYEDRELYNAETVPSELIDLINRFHPKLIYAPSPQEFHPDHRATAVFIQTVMKTFDTDAELLFYEVNQPIQVNRLVDITPVLDKKMRALRCYQSQLEEQPYDDISLALNRFRSMTLPAEATHAEGFLLFKVEKVDRVNGTGPKATPWSGKLVVNSTKSYTAYTIAVIVRTQGVRQSLLTEALKSITCQQLPCLAVVVVHAGSEMLEPVVAVCRSIAGLSYVIIHAAGIEKKRGYPLNLGLQYCLRRDISFKAVAFLDDDDILYPEFSQKMDQALKDTGADVIYAASNRRVPGQPAEEGYRLIPVLNIFLQNFIPINSYIICRDSLIKTQIFFDESLDVNEDWLFLLQLIEKGFRFEAIPDTLSEFRIISDGNKPVKDHPEIWDQAYRRIQAYIRGRMFLMNGRMVQLLVMAEDEFKSAQNQETIRVGEELYNRKFEIEALRREHTVLIEKYDRELNKANNRIENMQTENENLKQELMATRGAYDELAYVHANTANEVIALRESKSWKITEPLRRTYGLILKILRR